MPEQEGEPSAATVARFSGGFRILHWAHALPFLFLLLTGLTLFIPPVKAIHIDGFRLIPLLHVIVGIGFIISPIPVYVAIRSDVTVGKDLDRLFRIEPTDGAWARYAVAAVLGARTHIPPTGKFNLGQKLNSAFTVAATLGLMASGAVLAVNFFTKSVFSAAFVERTFPVHDFLMLAALPVVAAHIYLGSINPSTRESFRAITRGRVRRPWAREHHGLWLDDQDAGTIDRRQ